MNDLKMSDVLQRLRAEYGDHAPNYGLMYRRVSEGVCPGYRLGGQWRFRETDMDAIRAGLGLPPVAGQPAA